MAVGGIRAERMDPADVAWLHMDRPANLMVVNTVLWFDAPVSCGPIAGGRLALFLDAWPACAGVVVPAAGSPGGSSLSRKGAVR
jgi:hypothetical protein